MNSLGWIICHLAGQERRFWLIWAQGITDVAPELNEWGHFAKPANTPPLEGAWAAWHTVTEPSTRSSMASPKSGCSSI